MNFEVPVVKVQNIEKHPNADAIEIASVLGFKSIIRKGQFTIGELAIYIPEAAIVPSWLLKNLGLEGKLAGKDKNRVKAIKLRGTISQGILLPLEYVISEPLKFFDSPKKSFWRGEDGELHGPVEEGADVSNDLGITKWEPPIPIHLAGEVCNLFGKIPRYDIESIQKYPITLKEGEPVIFTEKLHGSLMGIGLVPGLNHPELFYGGDFFTFSKGLGAQGLVFKNNEKNDKNVYVKMLRPSLKNENIGANICSAMRIFSQKNHNLPVCFFGEIFGPIQDLHYGFKDPTLRIFDIYLGEPSLGRFLNYQEKFDLCSVNSIQMVPILYRGPFSSELIPKYRDGKESVSGTEANIREGIVITPLEERNDFEIGRVILKAVSPDYLLRGGDATEFN